MLALRLRLLSLGSRLRGNDAQASRLAAAFSALSSQPASPLLHLLVESWPYMVSPNSSRPISMRRISLVPAPIS